MLKVHMVAGNPRLRKEMAKELDIPEKLIIGLSQLGNKKLTEKLAKTLFRDLCQTVRDEKMSFMLLETEKIMLFLLVKFSLDGLLKHAKKNEKYSSHALELYNFITSKAGNNIVKGTAIGWAKKMKNPDGTVYQEAFREQDTIVMKMNKDKTDFSGKIRKTNFNFKIAELTHVTMPKTGSKPVIVKYGITGKIDTGAYDESYDALKDMFANDFDELIELVEGTGGNLSMQDQIKYSALFKTQKINNGEVKKHLKNCVNLFDSMSNEQKDAYEAQNEVVETWRSMMRAMFGKKGDAKDALHSGLTLENLLERSATIQEELIHLEEVKNAIEQRDWEATIFRGSLGAIEDMTDRDLEAKAKAHYKDEVAQLIRMVKLYAKDYQQLLKTKTDLSGAETPQAIAATVKPLQVFFSNRSNAESPLAEKYNEFQNRCLAIVNQDNWNDAGLLQQIMRLRREIEFVIKKERAARGAVNKEKLDFFKTTTALVKLIQDYQKLLTPLEKRWRMQVDDNQNIVRLIDEASKRSELDSLPMLRSSLEEHERRTNNLASKFKTLKNKLDAQQDSLKALVLGFNLTNK